MRRQAPAPWHFGILNLSHGVVTAGITGTLLAYLLRQQGLTPHAIANESSLLILPGTLFFLSMESNHRLPFAAADLAVARLRRRQRCRDVGAPNG